MINAFAAGVAQLVERKPSKLDVAGSSPVSRSWSGIGNRESGIETRPTALVLAAITIESARSIPNSRFPRVARVAQLVEHTLGKGEVTGSIPVASSEGSRFDR